MIVLLIALQLSSTNCISDGAGGVNCTTMSTPDMSQEPQRSRSPGRGNLIFDLFDVDGKRRHAKAVGKMLAKGDCGGAEKYALEKGDLDLADRVKEYCASPPSTESDWDFARDASAGQPGEQTAPPAKPK